MGTSLDIAVADDDPRMRDYLGQCLERLGHRVVSSARSGRELIEHCRSRRPDLVITDIKMPDMDGVEATEEIFRRFDVPVILVSAFHDEDLIRRASRMHVLGYLVKPIKESDLEPAIAVAMERSLELRTLRKEGAHLKQALEERKLIERAKGILMQRGQLSEQEAFRRLQKLASRQSRKMVEVARMIVMLEEASKPASE